MKKLMTFTIIGVLLLSGIGAIAYQDSHQYSKTIDIIYCSVPLIYKNNDGNTIYEIKEANSYITNPGEPIVPSINKKYLYPPGTKIKDVTVVFSDIKKMNLENDYAIAPSPSTIQNGKEIVGKPLDTIQEKSNIYPDVRYSYDIHVGLERNEQVIILNVQCYPIQYDLTKNLVYSASNIEIEIQYESPVKNSTPPEEYDMVIITPEIFEKDLQPLITHKNNHGIETFLKTTESIYDEYPGRDQPEKIKYFIKDAKETLGISYVLLCGGKKSLFFGNWGIEGPMTSDDDLWYVPVRYSNIPDSTGENGFLSDLYFSDLYKYENEKIVFEDWDSDGNNIFSQWTLDARDKLDLYPDIHIGRLACRNNREVQTVVEKIIQYEEGTDSSWFNKIVGIGGDSFDDRPPLGDDSFEGEERNQAAFDLLPEFTPVRIWASHQGTNDLVPSRTNIINTLNEGCGFVYFAGHGAPALYRTYWYNDWNYQNATDAFRIYDMLRLKNKEKLPICVIGACHNSEFNVSFFNYMNSPIEYFPTPECWSWVMTSHKNGGAIATIGYTGLEWVATYGWDNDTTPDPIQYFSGYIDNRFFYAYGVDGIDILGEACSQAITDYRDQFPNAYTWDLKTPQQWCLLGDPSLKIGGY